MDEKCKDCGKEFNTNAGYIRCDNCNLNVCVGCTKPGLLCEECFKESQNG